MRINFPKTITGNIDCNPLCHDNEQILSKRPFLKVIAQGPDVWNKPLIHVGRTISLVKLALFILTVELFRVYSEFSVDKEYIFVSIEKNLVHPEGCDAS